MIFFLYRDLSNNQIEELPKNIFDYNYQLEELWARIVPNLVKIIIFKSINSCYDIRW